MGGGFCRGVEKYECVLVPVAHSRTPGAPSSDDGLDPRLLPFPLLMAPLSLMLLPRLNLKPDDIEGCHYCIDLWNGCFDCDVDARLFYHSCVCWGSRPSAACCGWAGLATSQNLLAQQQQTTHQMHPPLALQTFISIAPTPIQLCSPHKSFTLQSTCS